jgi:hypothetical protein
MKPKITKANIEALAKALRGTAGNVYLTADRMFGKNIRGDGDAIFDRLERERDLFRCVECNVWKSLDVRDGERCCECAEEDQA